VKKWPAAVLFLLLAPGCASDYGAMEIRYSDYEIDSYHQFTDVRAFPAREILTVQGRSVDAFCDSLDSHSGKAAKVPSTADGVVLIVPKRCEPETGLLLKVSADGEVELLANHRRKDSADVARVWTSVFWTQDTTQIWNKLLEGARQKDKAAKR